MMNDESTVLENQNEDSDTSHDSVEETATPLSESLDSQTEKATLGSTDEALAGVFANTGTDLDSDCENTDSQIAESQLEQLRGELTQLREELERRNARLAHMEQIERQYAEFCNLYPDTPINTLSADVWQGVEDGNSLAAAFALAEHRRALSLKKASDSNADNRARSAGAVNNAESVEFSPAEVRAMSSLEVRANLPKIMRSMQKWHKN